jgi:hypothetical protein
LSGFTINGEYNSYSGWSVSGAGDVNGDGFGDLIVGAYANGNFLGKSYVVFGKTTNTAINLGSIVANSDGFVIKGEHEGDYSGTSVSSAGDVNGDGFDDLIIGAYGYGSYADKNTSSTRYAVTTTNTINSAINNKAYTGNITKIDGSISAFTKYNIGKSYVVFGKTTNTAINLGSIVANSDGFVIKGEHEGDYSGTSVSSSELRH